MTGPALTRGEVTAYDLLMAANEVAGCDIRCDARNGMLVEIRRAAWWVAREVCGTTHKRLGQIFHRDHSSVIFGLRAPRNLGLEALILSTAQKRAEDRQALSALPLYTIQSPPPPPLPPAPPPALPPVKRTGPTSRTIAWRGRVVPPAIGDVTALLMGDPSPVHRMVHRKEASA